jgi:hypothetical protein
MFAFVFLSNVLILIPAAGFVVAAGTGLYIRARQARQERLFRDRSTLVE